MKIELSQTSAQTITPVKDQPGVLRYVFNEPATNDGLLLSLIHIFSTVSKLRPTVATLA